MIYQMNKTPRTKNLQLNKNPKIIIVFSKISK